MSSVKQPTLSKRGRLDSLFYSMAEVAGLFGVSYTACWEAVRSGSFPVAPIKVGCQWRFPKRDVDRLAGLDDAAGGDHTA